MPALPVEIPLLRSLLIMASVIEARDPFTGGHIWRMSQYAGRLALRAGLTEDQVFLASLGGLVHDIGKLGIPESILCRAGRLSAGEMSAVCQHPEMGRRLLHDHPQAPLVLEAVLQHHERYDGEGYPAGLQSWQISLTARIVAVADAFDAMTSQRAYRAALPTAQALEIIASQAGKQFDPWLTGVFVALARAGEFDRVVGHSAGECPLAGCPVCGPIIAVPSSLRQDDKLTCPGCLGNYVLHSNSERFTLEWDGSYAETYLPQPDEDTISAWLAAAPASVILAISG